MSIPFGAQCSAQMADITNGAAGFNNYFNLTVQGQAAVEAAAIASGCSPYDAANWRKLVKHDIINCGGDLSIFDFMIGAFPLGETKKIPAKNMYFKSQCAMNWNVQATQSVSGFLNSNVTIQLARKNHSADGTLSDISVGARLLLKGDNTPVEIVAVNKSVPYAHTATLQPPSNYAISITGNTPMMVIPSPAVGTLTCHTAATRLPNQGHIYKMGMKSIREGWEVPLDAMLRCDQLQFAEGIDPTTGRAIKMWTTTAKEIKRASMMLTKHTDLLVGRKSTNQTLIDACLEGFDGLFPSIKYAGGNVMDWDPRYGLNPETDLAFIVANADQQKWGKEFYATVGFQYYSNMQKALFDLIGDSTGSCTFQAFDRSGAVDTQFIKKYQIKSHSFLGYTFHFNVASPFSDIRTIGGPTLANTAVYYPAQRVKDSAGNDVAPIDMYTFGTPMFDGDYQDIMREMWKIDGCLKIEGDLIESYGMTTHCLNQFYLHSPVQPC